MFSKLGRRLRSFVKDFWEISFGPLFDFIADQLGDALGLFARRVLRWDSPNVIETLIRRLVGPLSPRVSQEAAEAIAEIGALPALVFSPFIVQSLVSSIFTARLSAALKLLEISENVENRPGLPPMDAIIMAAHRIAVGTDSVKDVLARYGIPDEWHDPIIAASKPKLSLSDIAESVRRGLQPYDAGELYAATAGYNRDEFALAVNLTRRLLTASDLIVATIKGVLPYDEAKSRAGQVGIEGEDFDVLLRAARQLLPVGELINAWLRGILSDDGLAANLAAHGFAREDIETLKQLAYFIPPPSDLIRMAVREVFSPEIAERFGQFEDFPEAFKEWAAKQGISEFWARAYWAAHWDLPSITQGFEMLHRDVISREDLELLLRAQDVMPFWRDKLLQISYNPVTRIDILRMYQLGVIDAQEVERRFRHLGYSPEDARVLAEYTIRLAAQREKDLSRTDIEELLAAGAITEDQAREMLLRNGYSPEIADLIMERIRLKMAQKELEDDIEILKSRFLAGEITLNDVVGELTRMGAIQPLIERTIAQLERERRKQAKSLSPAQIRDALKAQLLTQDEALERLKHQGYNERDAQILISMWLAGQQS
jgi:hypothetical protein